MQQKKYNIFKLLPRILKDVWKRSKKIYLHAAIYTVAAATFPFIQILLPKIAIGTLEAGGTEVIKNLLITLAVFSGVSAVIAFVKDFEFNYLNSMNMAVRINHVGELLHKRLGIDYHYVEDAEFLNQKESAFNAVGGSEDGVEGLLKRSVTILPMAISVVVMFIMTGQLHPAVLAALVVHIAISILVSWRDHSYRYKKKEERAENARKVSYLKNLSSDFNYGKDIRIYNLKDRVLSNLKNQILVYNKLIKKLSGHKFALSFITLATLLITDGLLYGILIYQTLNGLPVSSFVMYTSLITTLISTMMDLADTVSFVNNEGQYVQDFFDFMDEDYNPNQTEDFNTQDTLEIEFKDVSFKYPNTDKYVLKNLNLTISKGQRLAIVGINGAGKSTIVKLMTGLFSPTSGHIYINGVDIDTIERKKLYSLYSAVFQDVNIFAFTVEENIACSNKNIDEERIQEVLKKVGLWEKVSEMENGTKQMMLKVIDDNGTDLSGGQRQKLSIARGLYKNAPMVIMDEPTAALDALAEAEIYQSFSDMVQGKTAVYISHRLASTKFCDKIALFSKDGLIEYGTHDELMKLQGEYYRMFTIQGKYYQEESV